MFIGRDCVRYMFAALLDDITGPQMSIPVSTTDKFAYRMLSVCAQKTPELIISYYNATKDSGVLNNC